jgi:RimJ/RimL family protein N-acetyltransferase
VIAALPDHIDLDAHSYLRTFRVSDAAAVAQAVGDSLEHLRPWMPWADAQSADVQFQRNRIRAQPARARNGEEWQYGLFAADDFLGSFGLMSRMGPRTMEIGYWIHVDAVGRGHATRGARALTDVALALDDVERVYICCDEANTRSAAVPRRLGYTLADVRTRAPEAPGETGRLLVWAFSRDDVDAAATAG